MSRPSEPTIDMLDRVTDAFFALDTDWRFTYLNDRAEALLKRRRTELLGRVMWDEFPETVETQFPDGFYRAMDEQVPVAFEVYHTPLETWFEARAYPSESGLSVYMRDVTGRKERENELAQHAAVVEAVHEGVVTIDEEKHIASINESIERSLGVDRDEVVGEPIESLPELASIPAESAIALGTAIGEILAGRSEHQRIELSFENADGEERLAEMRLVPLGEGSASVAGVIRDVTDQRTYERVVTSLHEVTRWLFETTDTEEICAIAVHAAAELLDLPISGVWLLDEERGFLEPIAGSADAYDEFGGLPCFESGEGLVWTVFEAGEPERFDDLEEVEGLYNPETGVRSEIISPIGTHGVIMSGAFSPDRFDDLDLELLSILAENVNAALDRSEREEALLARTRELEEQTERIEVVADVLSEDLQTQLSDLQEQVCAARDRPSGVELPLEEVSAPDGVLETIDRAERLVDDVREFARNATAVGIRTRIDLEDAIDHALTQSRLEEPTLALDAPATLRADRDRLLTMLRVLFDDVAMRGGPDPTIQIGLLGVDDLRSDARGFFVMDDGSEIPPEEHAIAFEPTHSSASEVAGLGLAVVNVIAEAHGWTVSVSTGHNGGTRFEVTDVTTLERREEE